MITLIFEIILIIILTGLLVFAFIFTIFLITTLFLDAPFIPTRTGLLEEINKALALKDGSILYDLGCGDGKILKYCLERNKKVEGIGVEKNFLPYLLAINNLRKMPATVRFENIFTAEIKNATHIYTYTSPVIMEKLLLKIRKECRKGTRVVSCDFKFPNVIPDETIVLENTGQKLGKKLFIYKIK